MTCLFLLATQILNQHFPHFLTISLHEGVQFSLTAEVNHTPGSYIYTMVVLHGDISTWPTKQLVDLSRRYVSTKRV